MRQRITLLVALALALGLLAAPAGAAPPAGAFNMSLTFSDPAPEDCLTGQGALNGELGSGHFLSQGQSNALLVTHQICHPGKISVVANDHIRALQRCLGLPGEQRERTWP